MMNCEFLDIELTFKVNSVETEKLYNKLEIRPNFSSMSNNSQIKILEIQFSQIWI